MSTRQQGFTLVELLVAIAIFAVLAALAYGGLNAVIQLRERNDAAMLRLRQIQQSLSIMERDFGQMTARPVRDAIGGAPLGALLAGPQNVPPIEFTRGGWTNPLGTTRSTLERVAYSLEGGKLFRYTWPELDRTPQTEPQKQLLLPDVTALQVLYLDRTDTWQEQWPPLNTAAGSFLYKLPDAVTIKLTLKDMGDITRIIEVASGP